jgi:hypothetical protein
MRAGLILPTALLVLGLALLGGCGGSSGATTSNSVSGDCASAGEEQATPSSARETAIVFHGGVGRAEGTFPVHIVLDHAPAGLSGFVMEVSIDNPAIASIVGVDFPASFLTSQTPPADSHWRLVAVDLQRLIERGATQATLATLRVQGQAVGTTKVHLQVVKMDDDDGNPMQPQVMPGSVTVC